MPQKALDYYNQALPITRQVGNRTLEATTLSNIGFAYIDMEQLNEATKYLEQSVSITLELRRGLVRNNRYQFLQAKQGTLAALVDILVQQNQATSAYEWVNLATTADLVEYSRLNNAKFKNPTAQKAIDDWNQQNKQLQSIRQHLQDKYSDTLFQGMRRQEDKVNQLAQAISKQYPETAELFETEPTDINKLQASIPIGTTIIAPFFLTNIQGVPDSIALFVLTKDNLTVNKVPLNSVDVNNSLILTKVTKDNLTVNKVPLNSVDVNNSLILTKENQSITIKPPNSVDIDQLIKQTYNQITNRNVDEYLHNLIQLYNLLIEPIESRIQATNPKQLSIIATDRLRYIPFEALFDKNTDQYLIQKYNINYLTHNSDDSFQPAPKANTTKKILALGNPIPSGDLALPGAEAEVVSIPKIFPGSEVFIHDQATFKTFQTQAPHFSFAHLATHSCFQRGGCPMLGLEENTILFADKQLKIGDAALLSLENVDLITLSACQTAITADPQGQVLTEKAEPISGLAYIFKQAGAKAVISSLWSVPDEATQEIMVQFYKNLNQGMSKSEALRKAKLSEIQRHPHPFFWSPFVLIGNPQ